MIELARRGEWSVPNHVANAIAAPSNRIGATLTRLRRAGLIEVEVTGTRGDKETKRIRLTAKGTKTAQLLGPVVDQLELA